MGRALVRQLLAEGCDVATCDVIADNLAETRSICEQEAPQGRKLTTHICDVADETAVYRFRDEVQDQHGLQHINLLFNNAGVSGGGSFVKAEERESWDRCFNICWGGVYNNARAFLPLLVASDEGHIINTSSVNGFWASLGPNTAHTAYSAAKFAVKGFSEALINDLRINAPHVKVSVVMPGHVGTSIVINSGKIVSGRDSENLNEADLAEIRTQFKAMGADIEALTDEQLRAMATAMGTQFRDNAPLTSEQAAEIILDGVKAEQWRILVGKDAHALDSLVRADPENAYTEQFMTRLSEQADWALGT